MEKDKHKFILVGSGSIANKHLSQIQRLGQLVAVCDRDPKKIYEQGQQLSVPVFNSMDQLIEAGIAADILVICTPNGLHASQTITALNAGYHVLCEKPMALTQPDAQAMLETAQRKNKLLMVVKQNRFNPPVQKLKNWIASGASGKVYSYSLNCLWNRNPEYYTSSAWRGRLDMDGGTLFTQFSHYIDFLYWIFGEIAEVNGFRTNQAHHGLIEFEDQGTVSLNYPSGMTGNIHYSINAFQKNMETSLTVLAQNGSIRIGGLSCNNIEYQNIKNESWQFPDETPNTNQYGSYTGSMSNHHLVYDHFIDSMKENKLNYQGTFEAMKTVELIEKIYKHSHLKP